MRFLKGLACWSVVTAVASPAIAQITIDADRTITNVDAVDLTAGFNLNNGAVLTIAAGTTVNVTGPVNIDGNARMTIAGTLAEPVRIVFGSTVQLDYRPAESTGIGMDIQHAIVTVAGSTFTSRHVALSGYQGGAFAAIAFESSIVEITGNGLVLAEANYTANSTLFVGSNRLMDFQTSNTQFTDCVFIRRSRPTNLTTALNAILSYNTSAGEHLFQNCRFSGSSVIHSFNDSSFRFVACDMSDTLQSFYNGFAVTSVTFEDSIVSPVNNNGRLNQNYIFTNSYPDLLAEELVLNSAESTTVTITNPLAAPPFRSADVNNDGLVNAADVNALMDIVVGNALASDLDFPGRADADGNGDIDERDVAVLRAFVDGILPQLPEVVAP